MDKYFVQGDNVINSHGKPILPDENGIIHVTMNGEPKRFLKEKFADYLRLNGHVRAVRVKKEKPVKKSRYSVQRTWTARNERKERTKYPVARKGISLMAKKGDVVLGPFLSLKECSDAIGISKASISKELNGQLIRNNHGYQFAKI